MAAEATSVQARGASIWHSQTTAKSPPRIQLWRAPILIILNESPHKNTLYTRKKAVERSVPHLPAQARKDWK